LFLHLLVLGAFILEPKLADTSSSTITLPNDKRLGIYLRDIPNPRATLLFIHGSPATARAFHAQFDESFPNVRLVAYDRPGFGRSSATGGPNNLSEQVAVLGYLLRSLEVSNCLLVGHSYGAAVALAGAIQYPDYVKGIVLIGGSVDPAQERPLFIQRVGAWPVIRRLIPGPLDCCNQELLSLKQDLVDLRSRLSQLHRPVIMVHGIKDGLVPVANVDFLECELGRVGKTNLFSKIIIPEYNHFIPWEHPEVVRTAIGRLLEDPVASRSAN
jgi:pimeloyl-ACP methyl ester carboxylesterase